MLAESKPFSAPEEDLESSDESSDDEPTSDSALICLMARDDEASDDSLPEVTNELSHPLSYDELLDKVNEYYKDCQDAAKIYQNHFAIISPLKSDKVTLKAELQVQQQCIEKNQSLESEITQLKSDLDIIVKREADLIARLAKSEQLVSSLSKASRKLDNVTEVTRLFGEKTG